MHVAAKELFFLSFVSVPSVVSSVFRRSFWRCRFAGDDGADAGARGGLGDARVVIDDIGHLDRSE